MKTLQRSALEKSIESMTFAEAVNFLRTRGVGFDNLLSSREDAHLIVRLCQSADRIDLLTTILGRFDLHTPEEWLNHLFYVAQGLSWEYGYKFQRFVINGHEEDGPGPDKLDDEDDFIRVNILAPMNPNFIRDNPGALYSLFELYRVNPGLPLVPYVALRGERTHRVRIQGSFPLPGKIGVHLDLKLTSVIVAIEDMEGEEVRQSEIFDRTLREKSGFPRTRRLSIPIFFDAGLSDEELATVEAKIYSQIGNYMKEFAAQEDPTNIPNRMTIERWEPDGDWDNRMDDLLVASWEDVLRIIPEQMQNFSTNVIFASPSLDLEGPDHNQITIAMGNHSPMMIRADFHFVKVRT